MSRNIISDYMLGLQARADTSSADIIADIINPQHSTTHDGVWMTIIRPLMFPVFSAKYRDRCPSSSSWAGAVLPWWWLVAEVVVANLTSGEHTRASAVSQVVGLAE